MKQFLSRLFSEIQELKEQLIEKEAAVEKMAAQITIPYASATEVIFPAMSDEQLSIHEEVDRLIRELEDVEDACYGRCDMARILLDTIEDQIIATALRLHYLNGLSWRATAWEVGVPDIRQKCHDFMKKEG